jgi:XRE family transcriptional regulator, aerobic/anaerobic benzoate catabolism transcriptional regulator
LAVLQDIHPPFPEPAPVSSQEFLTGLGARVRDLRHRRGMTRKQLAQESEVSERHLAQLESGEGNISILLLRRIAAVLHVPLGEMFANEKQRQNGNDSIIRFLERLPGHRREEIAARLIRDFALEQSVRLNRVALVGVRGAGKSTLGSRLAAELKLPYIELDQEIEKDTGIPLAEIFSLYGQSGYRAIEKRTLQRVLRERERAVISVAGGIVSEKETYEYLLANCFTVWVKAEPEELMARVIAQGDFRVMAGNDRAMEDLRQILESREALYRKADATLDTSGEAAEASFAKLKSILQAAAQ